MDLHEKFLYHIWDAGHLQPELKTVSGKIVKIQYQGQFNTNRGPDFSFAIIELDGQSLKGSVEIHLKTTDWHAHSHDEDPYYNRVILHVVLQHNQAHPLTIKENGETVDILELQDQMSGDIRKLWEEHDSIETIGLNRYCELLSAIGNDELTGCLNLYGKLRFHGKVRRFNAMLSLSNFDQLLYEGMMEALGYHSNKLNMLALAQALPLSELKTWYNDGMSCDQMISIFLFNSGLWSKAKHLLPEDMASSYERAYELQSYSAQKILVDWQLFRLRPASHPLYRLIAFLSLLYKYLGLSLLEEMRLKLETDNSSNKLRSNRLVEMLGEGPQSLPKPGKAVANNILLNIYLPILYLWYDKLAQDNHKKVVLDAYQDFPPLMENHITRFMHQKVNPSQIKILQSKAIYQQGLLELYHRHCNYHMCNQCIQSFRDMINL